MPANQHGNGASVVSRYDVPNERQAALADLLTGHLERWIRHRPGFVAGLLLRSIDEGHVVVFTTWQAVENGLDFMDCDEGRMLFADVAESGARERESATYHPGITVGQR